MVYPPAAEKFSEFENLRDNDIRADNNKNKSQDHRDGGIGLSQRNQVFLELKDDTHILKHSHLHKKFLQ
jgi:hypothetical protein